MVEQDPHDGTVETHPAFGVASASRSHGTGRVLFQSDLLHQESVTLTISTASRHRRLGGDSTFPRTSLVEVEMSLAQWGALVSSVGIGTGVPVTIRRTETTPFVARLRYAPRIQASLDEVSGTVSNLLERARETLAQLEEAIEGKRGVRAIRDALRTHSSSIEAAPSNAEFAVKSMKRAAETITGQARADIEAQILAASQATGLGASVALPGIDMPHGQMLQDGSPAADAPADFV
ncbi:hypothetical protein SAMN06295974_3867 [Plantibacter flavus]|uniref:Uncharacterized protein n=1 Tax=Plantibacter flavus TaxID=150123 RepID=A0A3N2BLA4_9MICO|nr:hypothetical protein [Plantibacter flavus]ROR75988.1 hypothetical protein EDD42_3939 [Plantibacter flavus]SMG49579.1 hypothetical protein SAMN06295974_3867 [Plantibacter flavus]